MKLITHPGKAHFDDFFATAMILAHHPDKKIEIERREPTQEELDDENVWVVDIGLSYDEKKKNFDHHQDLNIPASFVLIANHFKIDSKLKKITTWWDFKDSFDRFGPVKTGKKFSVENTTVLINPIESWIVELFETDPMQNYDLIKAFGMFVINKAKTLEKRLEFWGKEAQTTFLKGKKIIIGHTNDLTGLRLYRDRFMEEPASIAISYDNRGDGWKMIRFNDYENIDFCKISDEKEIAFAHKGGFVAKTKNLIPIEDLFKIIEKSIT